MDFSQHSVVVSLSPTDAFLRVCQLPEMERKVLQQVVTYEAKHQMPFPLEAVSWTHQILAEGERQSLLLFAAKREALDRFGLQFEMSGVEFSQIQAAPIALLNLWSLVRAQMERESPSAANAPAALLDVGHNFSTIVFRRGNEISLRILDVAGERFARKLVHAFNLTFEQAQRLKHAPYESPQISRVYEHIQPVFESLEGEMTKTLAVLKRDTPSLMPAALYCSGGGSLLHGLIRCLRNGADSLMV
jgi:type IV pilus assembly protein PilM